MKKTNRYFLGALFIFLAAAFLLISGSSVLLFPLAEEPYIPLGTLITWLGLISLPLILYFGNHGFRTPENKWDQFFTWILKGLLFLALLWAPVCYLLAGNFSFSFTEKEEFQGGQLAMKIFWYYSYFLGAAPLLLFLCTGLRALFARKK